MAWLIFGTGLLFLLVCAGVLIVSMQGLRNVQTAERHAQAERLALAATEREARARLSNPVVLEKVKAQQALQQMIRMSWFGLFDALEDAAKTVRGGVSLLSLVPSQTQAAATQVRLTAVAASAPVMLVYLRRLRTDPRIVSVELNSQQLDENVGPGVVRMQFTVSWNPQVVVHAQPAPAGKPKEPGSVADAGEKRPPVAAAVVNKRVP
ncbi:MAG: hypothetical protein ACK5N7_12185 [Curvibacter sp.]